MKQSRLTSSYIPAVIIALIGVGISALPFDRIDRSERFTPQKHELANDVRSDLNRVNEMAMLYDRIEGSKKRIVYNDDGRAFEAIKNIRSIAGEGVKNMKAETISKAQAAQVLNEQIPPLNEQIPPLNDSKVNELRKSLQSALLATSSYDSNLNQYDSLKR